MNTLITFASVKQDVILEDQYATNLFQWLSSLTSEKKKQRFIQGTLMIILSLKTRTLFYLKRYCKALRSNIQDAAISGE